MTSTDIPPAPVTIDYQPPKPRTYRPNIGLIGCGGITTQHLKAARSLGVPVVAFADVNLEAARARRDEFFPDADIYDDPALILARPDIEVVDIATHPSVRVPLIRQALEAGKHVLSQKPFVLDLAEGRDLSNLADRLGLKLAINQNGRWAPLFRPRPCRHRSGTARHRANRRSLHALRPDVDRRHHLREDSPRHPLRFLHPLV